MYFWTCFKQLYFKFECSFADDDVSNSEVEEASDEDKEDKEEEESEVDEDVALTRQYQQEVQEDSPSEDDDNQNESDAEKKKISKEKVRIYTRLLIKFNLYNQLWSTYWPLIFKTLNKKDHSHNYELFCIVKN